MVFLMRVSSHSEGYASAVRDVVRGIDDQIALTGIGTLEREITDSIAIIRIMGVLIGLIWLRRAGAIVGGSLWRARRKRCTAYSGNRRTPRIGRGTTGCNATGLRTSAEAHGNRLAIGVPMAFAVTAP